VWLLPVAGKAEGVEALKGKLLEELAAEIKARRINRPTKPTHQSPLLLPRNKQRRPNHDQDLGHLEPAAEDGHQAEPGGSRQGVGHHVRLQQRRAPDRRGSDGWDDTGACVWGEGGLAGGWWRTGDGAVVATPVTSYEGRILLSTSCNPPWSLSQPERRLQTAQTNTHTRTIHDTTTTKHHNTTTPKAPNHHPTTQPPQRPKVWSVGGKFGRSAAIGAVQPPSAQHIEKQGWSYVSKPSQVARNAHEPQTEITGLAFTQVRCLLLLCVCVGRLFGLLWSALGLVFFTRCWRWWWYWWVAAVSAKASSFSYNPHSPLPPFLPTPTHPTPNPIPTPTPTPNPNHPTHQDDTTLASRGMDGTLRLWDLRSFKAPLKTFSDLPANYSTTNVCFSPDERLVLTGTAAPDPRGGDGGEWRVGLSLGISFCRCRFRCLRGSDAAIKICRGLDFSRFSTQKTQPPRPHPHSHSHPTKRDPTNPHPHPNPQAAAHSCLWTARSCGW